MDKIIEIYSDISSDSVLEIEPLKKLPPPLIDLETDEIVLNTEKTTHPLMASNISGDGNLPKETAEESPDNNPNHWTKDMKKFYNDDWGDEEKFIVDKLQEKMEKNPTLWAVSQQDLLFKKNRKDKSQLKCFNCSQYGHKTQQCPTPKRIVKCHMCGDAGHNVDSCPNAKCLNCGNQTNSYVLWCNKCAEETYKQCTRCSLLGHYFINCSDNWRRYHSTVGKTEIDIAQNMLYKPERDMWCCNCGSKGHNQIYCQRKKVLHFPETFPYVASYDGSSYSEHRSHGFKRAGKYHEPSSSKYKRRRMQHYSKESHRYDKPNIRNYFNLSANSKKSKKKRVRRKPGGKLRETLDFIPI